LGPEQSGHIGAVGFDLYCRLLQEAVEDLRAGAIKRAPSSQPPTIDLPLHAHIPEEYLEDLDMRLTLYQRLARLTATKQVEDMAEELGDRFGPMPPQVKNLLYAVKVKIMAIEAGIQSIATEDGQLVLKMAEGKKVEKGRVFGDGVNVGTTQVRLDTKRLGPKWQGALEQVLHYLR
jgi:transcription-repair coupling factor (superfamily II helicase)